MSTAYKTLKTAVEVQAEIAEIIEWVKERKGDVDHGAFLEAADSVYRQACRVAGLTRVPALPEGAGMLALDFATAMVKMRSCGPHEIAHYSLPGAAAYRDANGYSAE